MKYSSLKSISTVTVAKQVHGNRTVGSTKCSSAFKEVDQFNESSELTDPHHIISPYGGVD